MTSADPDLAIYADWLLPIFQSDLNMDPDGSITNRDIFLRVEPQIVTSLVKYFFTVAVGWMKM